LANAGGGPGGGADKADLLRPLQRERLMARRCRRLVVRDDETGGGLAADYGLALQDLLTGGTDRPAGAADLGDGHLTQGAAAAGHGEGGRAGLQLRLQGRRKHLPNNKKTYLIFIFNSQQCCGSGSVGSICYWASLDPDPLVRGMDPDPDPSIIKQK
jgi:hypothetical protein